MQAQKRNEKTLNLNLQLILGTETTHNNKIVTTKNYHLFTNDLQNRERVTNLENEIIVVGVEGSGKG